MKIKPFRKWPVVMAVMVIFLIFGPRAVLAESGDFYFEQGNRFLKEARLEHAIRAFTEAIRLEPDHAEAYTNRGLAYLEEKEYPEAEQDFINALAIAPNDVMANNNLGVFYCGREDYDNALHYLQRAAGARTLSGPYGAIVYRNLGFVYAKKGKLQEARDAYGKANRLGATETSVRFDRRGYGEGSRDYALTLEIQQDGGQRE